MRFGSWGRVAVMLGLGVGAQMLSGCGAFFVCEGKASCPTTTSTSSTGTVNTGDYVYVSNANAGSQGQDIAGYTISSSGLTLIANYALGYVPVAMKVSPSNGFLYVASFPGNGATSGLYLYTITSTGTLTGETELQASANIASMDISPDGNYLYTIDTTGTVLTQFTLNTATGAYTAAVPTTISTVVGTAGCNLTTLLPVSQLCTLQVSPSGDYVAIALGNTGYGNAQTLIYPYSSTAGLTLSPANIPNSNALSGDFSLAFDKSDNLYIGRTSELTSYAPPYANGAAPVQESNNTSFATSATPRSVTLSKSYTEVFTADEGTSTISCFGISGTAQLTQLTGSPQPGPTNVSALGADNSGTYLVAAGYSATNGVELFTITATGLTAIGTSQATGAGETIPVVMALTH